MDLEKKWVEKDGLLSIKKTQKCEPREPAALAYLPFVFNQVFSVPRIASGGSHFHVVQANDMKRRRSSKPDPILRALQDCERPLRDWLELSPRNAALFVYDPVTALREANLGLDEAVLTEIDAILGNIQKKIKAAD